MAWRQCICRSIRRICASLSKDCAVNVHGPGLTNTDLAKVDVPAKPQIHQPPQGRSQPSLIGIKP
jgi:hypothetical protein